MPSRINARSFVLPGDRMDSDGYNSAKQISTLTQPVELPVPRRSASDPSEPAADGLFSFGELSSYAPKMKHLFQLLGPIAQSDLSLLIEGETGVGKEVVAAAVHRQSLRRDHPFVVLDCASKSPTAIAAELFGYEPEKHALGQKPIVSSFENANHGTLVLDHVEALAPYLQAKLLRALEKRQTQRVGDTRPVDFDVRLICVTSEDLKREVDRGSFRHDLYSSISQASVKVPPLRRRLVDLRILAQSLLARRSPVRFIHELPSDFLDNCKTHNWPGNVIEFENALHRALVMPGRGYADRRRVRRAVKARAY
jgi:DNA-binding NtrC family response regulator